MENNNPETSTDSSFNPNHDPVPVPDAETTNVPSNLEQAGDNIQGIEQDHQLDDAENIEETPPETLCTLESLSADIDQFLLSFPEWKEEILQESNDEKIPAFVDKFLDLMGEKIAEYESNEGKRKWSREADDEDLSFLEAVNRVSKLTASLSECISNPNLCNLINRIGDIHQQAMSYLEDEFRMLAEDYGRNKQDTESESETIEDNFLGYKDEIIANMNRIAKEMIGAGYESECRQAYMITRRHAFDEYLENIGFEKISIDEVQRMQWEALEREIPVWINAFKDSTTNYFSKEHKLAEAIYSTKPSISSSIFSNLIGSSVMIQLLDFTEGIAMTNQSAEKLFKFLDIYETLRDSIPAMDGLLPEEECENDLKTEMMTAKCRIGEVAIRLFCDLENSIESDTGKTPVPGGAVHPLTRYTMNYLKYACEYMATLEEVFKLHSKIERADSTSRPDYQADSPNINTNNNQEENHSPFSTQLMRVMDLLDSNLEAKAKLYKDIALRNIFLMNNGRYILQKIKGSPEIYQIVKDNWCRKKSTDLRNFHKNYQRETWSKVLRCLGHEGLQVNGKVAKHVLKERFKSFSFMFDEIHRTQTAWVVSDEQLQSELRVSISAVVIPAYRSFFGRFSQYLDPGRQSEKYIKYQPEDIEDCIDELFDGNAKRP